MAAPARTHRSAHQASPTGRPSRDITMRDIVASQKLLVDSLGTEEPGRGDRPVDGRLPVVPVGGVLSRLHEGASSPSVTAPRAPARPRAASTRCRSGWPAIPTGTAAGTTRTAASPASLEEIRYETLLNYGQNESWPRPCRPRREAARQRQGWAQIYDGHSLVTLRRAIDGFDITGEYAKLKGTKVLYVNSKTDKLFDIASCPDYVIGMRKAGVDVTYVELPSDKGHMASHAGRSDVGADPRRLHEEPGMIEGAAALLRWYVEQGVDEAIGEEPIDRFAAPPPSPSPQQRRRRLRRQPPARRRLCARRRLRRPHRRARRCRSNCRSSSRMRARWPRAAARWPSSRRRSAASRAAR